MLEYDNNNDVGVNNDITINNDNEGHRNNITINNKRNIPQSSSSLTSSTASSIGLIDIDKNVSDEMASIIDYYLKLYEQKMINHIYEQPHTPPTMFELRFKHQHLKDDILKLFEKQLMQTLLLEDDIEDFITTKTNNNDDDDDDLQQQNKMRQLLLDYLENEFEKLLDNFIDLSIKEYKMCQTGFVIGWKDNNNKIKQQQLQQQQQQQQPQHQLYGLKFQNLF